MVRCSVFREWSYYRVEEIIEWSGGLEVVSWYSLYLRGDRLGSRGLVNIDLIIFTIMIVWRAVFVRGYLIHSKLSNELPGSTISDVVKYRFHCSRWTSRLLQSLTANISVPSCRPPKSNSYALQTPKFQSHKDTFSISLSHSNPNM